jgi:hypothetical protein
LIVGHSPCFTTLRVCHLSAEITKPQWGTRTCQGREKSRSFAARGMTIFEVMASDAWRVGALSDELLP